MLTKVRRFLARLFPPELAQYVPGSKLVAGVILAALAALGVGGDAVVELPLVGEVPVTLLALGLGVYLYPPAEK
jgi:hypothetical protein